MFRSWVKPRFEAGWPARRRVRLDLTALDDRTLPSTSYLVTNLVSDQPGVAPVTDPNLVNAWGISFGPTTPFWVSSNGADLSTLYTGDVTPPFQKVGLEVTVPGAPTGQVFNGSTTDFKVTNASGTVTAPARFIFATESGTVVGWNPAVAPTTAVPGYTAPDGAIYKGLALDPTAGHHFLYAADFHNGKIDVLDSSFHLTHLDGSFLDPDMQKGFAPFNVAFLNGKLYVSYAKQDADREDDVAGPANGLIDVFDTDGHFLQRLVTRGHLNSPWGMTLAPEGFGDLGGALLVGNFGDGRINAYNPDTGDFIATLRSSPGHPLVIDGLWGLTFGNGTSGDRNTLYFAAGPDDEMHGLFGKITVNPDGKAHSVSVAGDFAAGTGTGKGAVSVATAEPARRTTTPAARQQDSDAAASSTTPATGSPGSVAVGLGAGLGAAPVTIDSDDPIGGPLVG
jgi:uncharacterized protein (TIGR03118 family)